MKQEGKNKIKTPKRSWWQRNARADANNDYI